MKTALLEKDRVHLPMEGLFLVSSQAMVDRQIDAAGECIPLHPYQITVLQSFNEYLMNLATQPKGVQNSPFCRIVLPPRTGKTVVAGEIIYQTGLCSTFVMPTKTLVRQTMAVLRTMLPEVPIGFYYGGEKRSVNNGGNPEEPMLHAFNALCGGAKMTPTPEEMLLRLEQINSVMTTLLCLDQRLQDVIINRFGLFGQTESTWDEIGIDFNVSRERTRRIFFRAVRILRKKHFKRSMFDRTRIDMIEEYPDLSQIVFRALSEENGK